MTSGSVLCPIDFSAASLAALPLAAEEARRRVANLDLVHVWQPGFEYVGEAAPIPMTQEVPFEAIRADLKGLDVDLPADRVRYHVEVGDPSERIVQLAEQLQSGLVVMGTHARHGLARWVIGSVCDAVLQRCPCPVLICRGPVKSED